MEYAPDLGMLFGGFVRNLVKRRWSARPAQQKWTGISLTKSAREKRRAEINQSICSQSKIEPPHQSLQWSVFIFCDEGKETCMHRVQEKRWIWEHGIHTDLKRIGGMSHLSNNSQCKRDESRVWFCKRVWLGLERQVGSVGSWAEDWHLFPGESMQTLHLLTLSSPVLAQGGIGILST